MQGRSVVLAPINSGTNTDPTMTGVKVEGQDSYHIQAVFSNELGVIGSGTGKIKLQVSGNNKNWSDYPDSELNYPPAGGEDNHQWEVRDVVHSYVRIATTLGSSPGGQISLSLFMKRE
jgi:hypothetical protein